MISDLTTEIFGKSGGSHTNLFGVEIFFKNVNIIFPKMSSYILQENKTSKSQFKHLWG